MNERVAGPDERALEADLLKPAFQWGVAQRRWRLFALEWPYLFVAITAKDGREYLLRLDVTAYPAVPPTGGPWDRAQNAVLAFARWPKGAAGSQLASIFRTNWQDGRALYFPYDRLGLEGNGHSNWRTELPSKQWRPSIGITQHLEWVHELLNGSSYSAPDRTAA